MPSQTVMAVRRNLAMQRLSDLIGGPPNAGHLGSGEMDLKGEVALLELVASGFELILQRLNKLDQAKGEGNSSQSLIRDF